MAHQTDDVASGSRQLRQAPAAHPRVQLQVYPHAFRDLAGDDDELETGIAGAATSGAGAGPSTTMRAGPSDSRSASASGTVATQSAEAPAPSAAAPASAAPWP